MRDQGVWSIYLGRWNGVQVRLHMFFLFFAALTLYLSWLENHARQLWFDWIGPLSLGILFVGIVVHEIGHVVTARLLGARPDLVILGPFGGLIPIVSGGDPLRAMMVSLAGPLTNFVVALGCSLQLTLGAGEPISGLWQPFGLLGPGEDAPWTLAVHLSLWVNGLLFAINLIPAFPFDGGTALRSLLEFAQPQLTAQQAGRYVAWLAKSVAVFLLFAAWLERAHQPEGGIPLWFPLILLSIFIYFSARKEEVQWSDRLALGPSAEGAAVGCSEKQKQPAPAGRIARWYQRRREMQQQRQRQIEAEEDGRVDEILSRLHDMGINGLSAADREILMRASARYRNRADA